MIPGGTRLIAVMLVVAAQATPVEAAVAMLEIASLAVSLIDEILVLAVVVGACFLVDKASWSFLTGQKIASFNPRAALARTLPRLWARLRLPETSATLPGRVRKRRPLGIRGDIRAQVLDEDGDKPIQLILSARMAADIAFITEDFATQVVPNSDEVTRLVNVADTVSSRLEDCLAARLEERVGRPRSLT